MVVHPLYSPEKRPTPIYGPCLTNMGVPREGVMVDFTQFHLSVVVGHPLAMGVVVVMVVVSEKGTTIAVVSVASPVLCTRARPLTGMKTGWATSKHH